MNAHVLLAGAALLCALVGGYNIGKICSRAWVRSRRSAVMVAHEGERVGLVQRGIRPLIPFARWALNYRVVRRYSAMFVMLCQEKGIMTTEVSAASMLTGVVLCISVAVGLVSWSVVGGIAAACCAGIGFIAVLKTQTEKVNDALREQVPDALRSLEVCFRSGLSLVQALSQTAHEIEGGLGARFSQAARRLEMGATPTEALRVLRGDDTIPELAFVAVALDVQHQSGGSVVFVLESARESVESGLALARTMRVQTAQARLSARIVCLMPFLLVALFSLISDNFIGPFFESVTGMALLGVAISMQVLGIFAIRKTLDIAKE